MQDQSTTIARKVEYRDIKDFPGYRIGMDGSVWVKGAVLKQIKCYRHKNRNEVVKLIKDGHAYVRSVRELVKATFGWVFGDLPGYPGTRDISGMVFNEWTVIRHYDAKACGRHVQHRYLCRCSCGKERPVWANAIGSGQSKSCGCKRPYPHKAGPTHPAWKTGRTKQKTGYITLRGSITKFYQDQYCVQEHVAIMSEYLGRKLYEGETVHHKNGIRDDNRIENLELWRKYQPFGQRVEDIVAYAKEILEKYDPDTLAKLEALGRSNADEARQF